MSESHTEHLDDKCCGLILISVKAESQSTLEVP